MEARERSAIVARDGGRTAMRRSFDDLWCRVRRVTYTVARAREGVGSHWGFTVISAPGAAAGGVKPQVGPTWGTV